MTASNIHPPTRIICLPPRAPRHPPTFFFSSSSIHPDRSPQIPRNQHHHCYAAERGQCYYVGVVAHQSPSLEGRCAGACTGKIFDVHTYNDIGNVVNLLSVHRKIFKYRLILHYEDFYVRASPNLANSFLCILFPFLSLRYFATQYFFRQSVANSRRSVRDM